MVVLIPGVLEPAARQAVVRSLEGAAFVSGHVSAGEAASRVKHNLQLPRESEVAEAAGGVVVRALLANSAFARAALPHTVLTPQFNRYDAGMRYGAHLDNPLRTGLRAVRSDVSISVFLNDPEEYRGGDLVVRTEMGEQRFRGRAGDALVYPSSYPHEVTEIEGGTRWVAVTWAQSLVRDSRHRQILSNLSVAIDRLERALGRSSEIALLEESRDNLLRLWTET
jgi:PKHD-type hydroxylase